MQLGLRAKLTMVMPAMVRLPPAVLSLVFLQPLMQKVLNDTETRANELVRTVFSQASHAESDAKTMGMRPVSDDPQDIHDFVQQVFETSDALNSQLAAAAAVPIVYEVSIVDTNGKVLVSSDPNDPGKIVARHQQLSRLGRSPVMRQASILSV